VRIVPLEAGVLEGVPVAKFAIAAVAALFTMTGAGAWSAARRTSAEAPVRWTDAESQALDEAIERLEERLLAHQARVSFWQEMQTRHADVSAVACTNLGTHAEAIRVAEQRNQVRYAERGRRRVASAAAVPQ
jgi:hypothetical protein